MKKVIKLSLCLLLVAGLVACGGKASTEKQEKIVTDFFVSLKAGEVDKMSTLCTTGNADVKAFTSIMDTFKPLQDANTYGETFAEETTKFIKNYFNQVVVSYEIKDTKKDGDNYIVNVNATLKEVNPNDFSMSATQKVVKDYQESHLSELQKIYLKDGQKALTKAIYTGIAPDFYKQFNEVVANSKDKNLKLVFTLVPDGDNWLISKSTEVKTTK